MSDYEEWKFEEEETLFETICNSCDKLVDLEHTEACSKCGKDVCFDCIQGMVCNLCYEKQKAEML